MFVDGMCEFMYDDIVSEILWQPHQFDIEIDSIPVATAPPPGFLMTARDTLVGKSELPGKLHRSMREIGFRQETELSELLFWKRNKSWLMFFLLLNPCSIFYNKSPDFSLWNPHRRTHDYLACQLDTETHTAEPRNTDDMNSINRILDFFARFCIFLDDKEISKL